MSFKYCVKAVVFDLDGTLIDTMKYFGKVASEVIYKYYGIPKKEAKSMYFRTSGIPFFQQLEVLFPGDARNPSAAKEYEEKKLRFFFSEPFPNKLYEVLKRERLRHKELIFVVSSNNFEHLVLKYFEDNNIKDLFDEILGYRENFSKGKDHFEYLMNKYRVGKEEMVFIGDSWWDAKIAIEFGIPFVAIDRTFSKEEWQKRYPHIRVIKWFEELPIFLEEVAECKH